MANSIDLLEGTTDFAELLTDMEGNLADVADLDDTLDTDAMLDDSDSEEFEMMDTSSNGIAGQIWNTLFEARARNRLRSVDGDPIKGPSGSDRSILPCNVMVTSVTVGKFPGVRLRFWIVTRHPPSFRTCTMTPLPLICNLWRHPILSKCTLQAIFTKIKSLFDH